MEISPHPPPPPPPPPVLPGPLPSFAGACTEFFSAAASSSSVVVVVVVVDRINRQGPHRTHRRRNHATMGTRSAEIDCCSRKKRERERERERVCKKPEDGTHQKRIKDEAAVMKPAPVARRAPANRVNKTEASLHNARF